MDQAVEQRGTQSVVPRAGLEFGFDEDIPRHWFEDDAFKTRFFDAMSTLFPEGERFFIACVRDYRDQVDDPELQQQVRDFIFQEGQHGLQHDRFNARLGEQGIDVARIEENNKRGIRWMREHLPRPLTLSMTAAAEHLTAIMAHMMLGNQELMGGADRRMRALYNWHAIEEIEHKAVAFDVMQKVAGVGYFTRSLGLLLESISFPVFTLIIMNHMLKVDGVPQRGRVWLRGLWWLYRPGGVMSRLLVPYLQYYKPGFHPWQYGRMEAFRRWQSAYAGNQGDPVAASDATLT